jgi:hypothetical protein
VIRAALALLLLSTPALAREAEPPAPVAVGLIIDSTDAPQLGPRVRLAFKGVLEHDPRLSLKNMDLGSLTEGGPLVVADEGLRKAEKQFKDADLDPAKVEVDSAIKTFEENLPELVRRDGSARLLRDAYILLSKIRFFSGDFDGSKEALRHVFAIDPKQTFTPLAFPTQMKRVVVESRLLFDTLGFSKLEISSEPSGAVIYINGTKTPNATPSSFEVACGPNVIEVRLPGHAPQRVTVDVGGVGDHGKVNVSLKHGDDPESKAREATSMLGDGAEPKVDLQPVADSLQVDALVLVHIHAGSDGRFRLSGELWRKARSGRGGGPAAHGQRLERSGSTGAIEGEAETLARTLTEPLHERVKVAEADSGDSGWKRFRRSKAFWWVIGGVAGAIVVGTAVGVGAGVGTYEAHKREIARETVLLGGN